MRRKPKKSTALQRHGRGHLERIPRDLPAVRQKDKPSGAIRVLRTLFPFLHKQDLKEIQRQKELAVAQAERASAEEAQHRAEFRSAQVGLHDQSVAYDLTIEVAEKNQRLKTITHNTSQIGRSTDSKPKPKKKRRTSEQIENAFAVAVKSGMAEVEAKDKILKRYTEEYRQEGEARVRAGESRSDVKEWVDQRINAVEMLLDQGRIDEDPY